MRETLSALTPYVKGFLGAVLGVILVLFLLHAWADHQALHELGAYINLKAPAINKLP